MLPDTRTSSAVRHTIGGAAREGGLTLLGGARASAGVIRDRKPTLSDGSIGQLRDARRAPNVPLSEFGLQTGELSENDGYRPSEPAASTFIVGRDLVDFPDYRVVCPGGIPRQLLPDNSASNRIVLSLIVDRPATSCFARPHAWTVPHAVAPADQQRDSHLKDLIISVCQPEGVIELEVPSLRAAADALTRNPRVLVAVGHRCEVLATPVHVVLPGVDPAEAWDVYPADPLHH